MAKDIMTSGIEMSDVIKTTGFPVPEDMEGKTFAECVSGGGGSGGGSIPLYAWHTAFSFEYMPIYTTTESPKVGDKVYTGANGDMDTEILSGVITSIENDVYHTNINTSYPAFSGRYEEKDTIISGDAQGGSVIVEPLAVTENGVYTAPSGKAYSPVTVNVPSGGAFRYFDGRESGYASMPTGFWVIRKDQTSGNAHCLITTANSNDQSVLSIKKLDSNGLMVDEYYREYFLEVTEDVVISALV